MKLLIFVPLFFSLISFVLPVHADILNITATPTLVKAGDTVTVTFQSTEPLAANPTVTLGGQPMTFEFLIAGFYTYTYTVAGTEGDGYKDVEVSVVDPAGHPGSGS